MRILPDVLNAMTSLCEALEADAHLANAKSASPLLGSAEGIAIASRAIARQASEPIRAGAAALQTARAA